MLVVIVGGQGAEESTDSRILEGGGVEPATRDTTL